MDIQNHYYGHSSVLAAYAGLGGPRHLAGLLQHGWTLVSPLGVHFGDFPHVGSRPGRSLFVWSHSARSWDPARAERPSTPIGSPFSYLERMLQDSGWSPSGGGGPVYFPLHSSSVIRVSGDQAALAREVAVVDGPSTVCLHTDDCRDPRVVAAWETAGHRVVTAGHRRDPLFLLRVMDLLTSADVVSSNRLSSSLIYAASLGLPVQIHGDPMVAGVQEQNPLDMAREIWPEFHEPATAPAFLREVARAELGADRLLSPERVREVLGWDRRHVGPGFDYWLGSSLIKAGKVVGISKRAAHSSATVPDQRPLRFLRQPLAHLPARLPGRLPTPLQTVRPERISANPGSRSALAE